MPLEREMTEEKRCLRPRLVEEDQAQAHDFVNSIIKCKVPRV